MAVLPPRFYARATEQVARAMLGTILECTVNGVRTRGRIVETEAYLGEHDAACHAAIGRTPRTEGLYGPPGTAYVYRIYGMYWCANAVTRRKGWPAAVLIRALEPLEGVDAMWARRPKATRERDLCAGPGRLCDALGISGHAHHGAWLHTSALRILQGAPIPERLVARTARIGMNPTNAARDWPLRWIVRGHPCVSK
ncbi:MAG: DNA-3-methyladenine glycosylase [Gemmatimonadaceae bacterium]|nr:DNA-3-methyladenine glycosylase [Gemmatimonadaceae bacterium]